MNTSESANANPMARSRGRKRLNSSFHFGTLTASSIAPISEVIESQRHGNCISDNLGMTAHKGLLKGVAIRNVPSNKTKRAFKARCEPSRLKERTRNKTPGNTKPMTASSRMFAYQVFRFVSAAGENRKLRR